MRVELFNKISDYFTIYNFESKFVIRKMSSESCNAYNFIENNEFYLSLKILSINFVFTTS